MVEEINNTQDTQESVEPSQPAKAAVIESRFLFVDIAALRAKQLRRGATPRIPSLAEGESPTPEVPRKAERVAMEEVRKGLVFWDVPDPHPPGETQ